MIDFELVVDEMIIAASAAIIDGEVLELEPSKFSYCMLHVMEKLRQAEKDAARYRWLRDDAYNYLSGPMIFNCDYCGNPAPDDDGDVIAMVGGEIDSAIDEAMNASNN